MAQYVPGVGFIPAGSPQYMNPNLLSQKSAKGADQKLEPKAYMFKNHLPKLVYSIRGLSTKAPRSQDYSILLERALRNLAEPSENSK